MSSHSQGQCGRGSGLQTVAATQQLWLCCLMEPRWVWRLLCPWRTGTQRCPSTAVRATAGAVHGWRANSRARSLAWQPHLYSLVVPQPGGLVLRRDYRGWGSVEAVLCAFWHPALNRYKSMNIWCWVSPAAWPQQGLPSSPPFCCLRVSLGSLGGSVIHIHVC